MRHLLGAACTGVLALVVVVDVGTSGAIVAGLAATAMITGLVAPYAAREPTMQRAKTAARAQPAA